MSLQHDKQVDSYYYNFFKSDKLFTSKKVLLSAAVTSDHSVNKRAVGKIKTSGMISREINLNMIFVKRILFGLH